MKIEFIIFYIMFFILAFAKFLSFQNIFVKNISVFPILMRNFAGFEINRFGTKYSDFF